jgi:predicted nucleic acid-binding protein
MDPTEAALQAVSLYKQSALVITHAIHYFCVMDRTNALRRQKAEQLVFLLDRKVSLGWCCRALKETRDDLEQAMLWVKQHPQ